MASARRVLLFVGAEDTDAEWELIQSHLPARLSTGAPHETQAIVVERVPLDPASDVAALHARARGLDGVVWIVVLGEAYGPDASVAQLEAAGGVGLADTSPPSVLDLVLRHVVLTRGVLGPARGDRVLVYERALPPGGRAPDARLVRLAEALRALAGSVSVSRYEIDPGASAWERIFGRDAWLASLARDVRQAFEPAPADADTPMGEFALALQHRADKDPYFVRPTYWQEPLPSDAANDLPPASLRQLHFQRLGSERTITPQEVEDVPRPDEDRTVEHGASRPQPLPPPPPAWSLVVPALIALFVGGVGLVWLLLRTLR